MGIHINVDDELSPTLKEFCSVRKISRSKLISQALSNLFDQEQADPTTDRVLRTILDRKFSIPKVFTTRCMYTCLYMNAKAYPDKSSKKYWGNIVYLSEVDKTNSEVFVEIQEDLKHELKKHKEGK